MCIDILRNPVKSLAIAKKSKNMNKTMLALVESSVLFALAAGILVARTSLLTELLLMSTVAVFLVMLIGSLLMGLVVHISASTLTSRGKYFDGLTSVVYGMLPISLGFFLTSLVSFIPFSIGLQIIILAITLAVGISTVYRGIKELYSTDMVTSFIVVSVAILVIFVAVYASAGITILNRVAAMGVI